MIETASAIGRQLVERAVWHEDRCTWVGALPEEGPGESVVMTYAGLTPDLYGGTSGVAVFLAELSACTGDEAARATALGAARHAVTHADAVPESAPGLHAGRAGLALAVARVGELLAEPALVDAARGLALAAAAGEGGGGFDLMAGAAGAVVGLLLLEPLLGGGPALDGARRHGERLLATAVREGDALSWPLAPGGPRLAGLSHGAAGAAVAFLELGAATGEPAWRDAAAGAFAYERALYEPRAGNWPDLRGAGRRGDGPSFPAFWCHGAPGIALSRLRAIELADDDRAREEAEIALDTTRAAVEVEIARRGNFSLCHGLAGNAEVLLLGRALLGDGRARDEEVALAAAAHGAATYGGGEEPWPCGTYEGQTASLFLGLAGIGRFYLRLHDPALPSLLLPTLAAGAVLGAAR